MTFVIVTIVVGVLVLIHHLAGLSVVLLWRGAGFHTAVLRS